MNINPQSATRKSFADIEAEAAKLDPTRCVVTFEHVKKRFGKHTAVSDEDFAANPLRNRLSVLLSRTRHLAYHIGQIALAPK